MMALQFLLFLGVVLAASEESSYEAALGCARRGDLVEALRAFETVNTTAKSLQAMASLELLIYGDARRSVEVYEEAKLLDAKGVSPLAELHLSEKDLALGDAFWTAAFGLKKLADDSKAAFEIHTSLGMILEDAGAFDLAKVHFESALRLDPENVALKFRTALTVPAIIDNSQKVHRDLERRINELLPSPLEKLDELAVAGTFYFAYLGGNDAQLATTLNDKYAVASPNLRQIMITDKRHSEVLKIGFVSSYFFRHSVCKLFCGIVERLAQSFEVTLFSSVENEDDWSKKLFQAVAHLVRLPRGALLSNRHLAIGQDVLIYTDLEMDRRTWIWANARMAPVQILTWGHPHTSGLPNTIDYFLSSDLFEENDDDRSSFYTEQLLRFDSLTFFFDHPEASRTTTHQHNVVYLCPQSLPKFHPSFDEVIRRLLEDDTEATVLITFDPKRALWLRALRKRLDPKLSDNKDRFLAIPLVKDPFPFGGGVTTLEAFSVCKLVVTLPSLQTVPQLTAGMYRHMRLNDDLVLTDIDTYVEAASRLAHNVSEREALENNLCNISRDPLLGVFQSEAAVHEWASFLERVSRSLEI